MIPDSSRMTQPLRLHVRPAVPPRDSNSSGCTSAGSSGFARCCCASPRLYRSSSCWVGAQVWWEGLLVAMSYCLGLALAPPPSPPCAGVSFPRLLIHATGCRICAAKTSLLFQAVAARLSPQLKLGLGSRWCCGATWRCWQASWASKCC